MKRFRNFLLLFCSIFVLGSLTACGSNNTGTTDTSKNASDTNRNNGADTMNGATDGKRTNDTTKHDGNNSVMDDVTDGIDRAVDDTANGINRAVDDATRDDTAKKNTTSDTQHKQENNR
ncbi:MAG: hypothetical protein U0L05_07340 [Schaedlerella sp.]|nr:hypothetical protein [Schaedlerella sp.]